MMTQLANQATVATTVLPPPVPRVKGTKKYLGERATLGGTRIDRVLFDAFETERKTLGISASELMGRILFTHYRRPALSFEEGSQPSPEPTE
ncbi:MAG: hypothetical protein AB1646_24405 [Thermodesulfobacteriota bacterium]